MDETPVHEKIKLIVGNGDQCERVDGVVEVRKQPARKRKCLVLEARRDTVMNDEIHAVFKS